MKHTINLRRGPWIVSVGVGLLCIPLAGFLLIACALIAVVGPIAGLLGYMTLEDK